MIIPELSTTQRTEITPLDKGQVVDGVDLNAKTAQGVLGAKNDIGLIITSHKIPGSTHLSIRGGELILGEQSLGLCGLNSKFICSLDGTEYVQANINGQEYLVSSKGEKIQLPEGRVDISNGQKGLKGQYFNLRLGGIDSKNKVLVLPLGELNDGALSTNYFEDELEGAGIYIIKNGEKIKIDDFGITYKKAA